MVDSTVIKQIEDNIMEQVKYINDFNDKSN